MFDLSRTNVGDVGPTEIKHFQSYVLEGFRSQSLEAWMSIDAAV